MEVLRGARRTARARLRLRRRPPAARVGAGICRRRMSAGSCCRGPRRSPSPSSRPRRRRHPRRQGPTRAVLHGLYWLVANLAERSPLLLTIDDVHWADGLRCASCCTSRAAWRGCRSRSCWRCAPARRAREPELLRRVAASRRIRPSWSPAALSPAADADAGGGAARSSGARRSGARVPSGDARQPVPARGAAAPAARRPPSDMAAAAVEHMASGRVAAEILLRVARVGASAAALVRRRPCSASRPTLELAARLAGARRGTAADARRRARATPRSRAGRAAAAAVLRPPARPQRRLRGHAARRPGAAARPRGRRCSRAIAAMPRRGRHAPAAQRPRGRRRDRRAPARRGARGARARRSRDRGRVPQPRGARAAAREHPRRAAARARGRRHPRRATTTP